MKLPAIFIRTGCVLPPNFHPVQVPACAGWMFVEEATPDYMGSEIRKAGWHFMSLTESHLGLGYAQTAALAQSNALARALGKVAAHFNAAEVISSRDNSYLGLRVCRVLLHARHIQESVNLDPVGEMTARRAA